MMGGKQMDALRKMWLMVLVAMMGIGGGTLFGQGAWIPANADFDYPRTLVKRSELPILRSWIAAQPEIYDLYALLYSHSLSANPVGNASNGDRRYAAHTAKNCAFIHLLDRKPGNGQLDTLTVAESAFFRNKAIAMLNLINNNVETYPDFENYLWRSSEICENLIAYDLLKGASVADSLLANGRGLLHQYLTSFHTQVSFNTFNLGLTSLHVDNHTLRAVGAIGMGAVVLNDAQSSNSNGQPAVWLQTALYQVDNVLWRSNVRQSEPGLIAGYSEGPHYLRFGMKHNLEFFHALANFVPDTTFSASFDGNTRSIRHPFFDPNFDLLWEWVMRIRMPDGRNPQLEDCFAITFNCDMALTEKPQFRPLLHGSRLHEDGPSNLWEQLHHSSDDMVADFIASMTPSQPLDYGHLQVLPESGNVVFRSAWDSTATYMHLAAKHGRARTSANGHNHADVTAFNLHAFGQELAFYPGYLKWDRRLEVAGPEQHNMILVDGQGPPNATTGFAGDADGFAGQSFELNRLHYAEVSTSYQGASVVRKPLFVRKEYFIIADELISSVALNYEWRLHGMGLANGDSSHGTFILDTLAQLATWQKNGVSMAALVTAEGGITQIGQEVNIHELYYDSAITHSTLQVWKSGQGDTRFMAALVPYELNAPQFAFNCPGQCDAIGLSRGGFVDHAFLGGQSGTGLRSDAGFCFHSEDSSGLFADFFLENGSWLLDGQDSLCAANVVGDWALSKMDNDHYRAYAAQAGQISLYGLGFVPQSVNGWNVVQSWQYHAGADRTDIQLAGPGYFDIHRNFVLGQEQGHAQPTGLQLFPNPSTGHFSAETRFASGTWMLFGLGGRKLAEGGFESQRFELEFNDLPSGCYFLRLQDEAGEVELAKWIKE